MTDQAIPTEKQQQDICRLAGRRAENFYTAHRLCCSESVLLVINQGFSGPLSRETAVSLGAGFCGGLGDAGCVCGGLAGAVMALGLFLAPNRADGLPKKHFRELTKKLHDRFHQQAGSTCCRVLISEFTNDPKARKTHCRELTGLGAQLTAELLLETRPDLLASANLEFLNQQDSRISGLIKSFSKN